MWDEKSNFILFIYFLCDTIYIAENLLSRPILTGVCSEKRLRNTDNQLGFERSQIRSRTVQPNIPRL